MTDTCIGKSVEYAFDEGSTLGEQVDSKKALITALFFTYIIFILATVGGSLLKDKKPLLAQAMAEFSNDVGFRCFFFIMFAVVGHSVSPVAFLPVLGYLWLGSMAVLVLARLKPEKWIFLLIAYGVQALLTLVLILLVLSDHWCRFPIFRYIINRP